MLNVFIRILIIFSSIWDETEWQSVMVRFDRGYTFNFHAHRFVFINQGHICTIWGGGSSCFPGRPQTQWLWSRERLWSLWNPANTQNTHAFRVRGGVRNYTGGLTAGRLSMISMVIAPTQNPVLVSILYVPPYVQVSLIFVNHLPLCKSFSVFPTLSILLPLILDLHRTVITSPANQMKFKYLVHLCRDTMICLSLFQGWTQRARTSR